MADTITPAKKQSKAEIRQWDVDFSADLIAGVTVTSATATLYAPDGTTSSGTVGAIVANVVPVKIGPVSDTGTYTLSVLATYTNGEKSEARIVITVVF